MTFRVGESKFKCHTLWTNFFLFFFVLPFCANFVFIQHLLEDSFHFSFVRSCNNKQLSSSSGKCVPNLYIFFYFHVPRQKSREIDGSFWVSSKFGCDRINIEILPTARPKKQILNFYFILVTRSHRREHLWSQKSYFDICVRLVLGDCSLILHLHHSIAIYIRFWIKFRMRNSNQFVFFLRSKAITNTAETNQLREIQHSTHIRMSCDCNIYILSTLFDARSVVRSQCNKFLWRKIEINDFYLFASRRWQSPQSLTPEAGVYCVGPRAA